MKKRVLWAGGLLAVILLAVLWQPRAEPVVEPVPAVIEQAPPPEPEPLPTVYVPPENLTIEETVEAYFAQQYLAYVNTTHIDISSILDMGMQTNENLLIWSEALALRRKLLLEHELCYVETQQYPYTITYEEPEDHRMEFWREHSDNEGSTIVHLRLAGEKGRAYPPILAMNAQHSFFMIQEEGTWKIMRHYFPGAVRKFMRSALAQVPTEDELLEELLKEFAPADPVGELEIPDGAILYHPDAAVEYARQYTEFSNPVFYQIIDWMGNCSNFVSQCLWFGFGDGKLERPDGYMNMTPTWYGGEGGGSPAWENVDYFWNEITGSRDFVGQPLPSISAMTAGDVIQTRSKSAKGGPDDYNHMLVLLDEDTLLLAQNSPGALVYYADLVNVETRFVRPVYVVD